MGPQVALQALAWPKAGLVAGREARQPAYVALVTLRAMVEAQAHHISRLQARACQNMPLCSKSVARPTCVCVVPEIFVKCTAQSVCVPSHVHSRVVQRSGCNEGAAQRQACLKASGQ